MTVDLLTPPGFLVPPAVDDATRRQFLSLLAAAGLLTACGSDGSPGTAATAPKTRSVDHTSGTTEVPVDPRRVVTLDNTLALALIALDLPPAAAAGTGIAEDLDALSTLLPPGLDILDTATNEDDEVNVEAIAALSPDLVLGTDLDTELFGQLSSLAPTVLVERGRNGRWRARFRAAAAAVNRAARAAEVEAAYEQMLAALRDATTDVTVAFVRPNPDGQFQIDGGPDLFAGSVATDAGIPALTAPEGVGELFEASGQVTVSGERLDILSSADLIVVGDFRSTGAEQDGISQFEANPLWAALPAVQAGRVLQLDGLIYNGGNHYAAELLLRAVAEALA